MSGEKVIHMLFGIALVVTILFFSMLTYIIFFVPKPIIERNVKTTCVIPATEWSCFIDEKEITCKGLIVKDNEASE